MTTYRVHHIQDGEPTFSVPMSEIFADLEIGGALKTLTASEYHTDQQRKWYRGVCLKGLSDWNGETVDEWDLRIKALCGGNLLKTEPIMYGTTPTGDPLICHRQTIVGVCKSKMTKFIENILSAAITNEWMVTPPDDSLRKEMSK